MGLGGISIWQLLIILAIILLIFGTKKLRNIGSDLGGAVKGFKDSMSEEKQDKDEGVSEESLQQTENSESLEEEPSQKKTEEPRS